VPSIGSGPSGVDLASLLNIDSERTTPVADTGTPLPELALGFGLVLVALAGGMRLRRTAARVGR
jgi:hypothetical protein